MTTTGHTIQPIESPAEPLGSVVERVTTTKERVVLIRDGRPIAAVVPIEDIETLESIEDERDSRIVREARARWEEAGLPTATLEQFAEARGIDLSNLSDTAG